jgi:Ca2+-binding EF-hand superfamily protein
VIPLLWCRYGLRDYGIDLSNQELEQVFAFFDRDGNGFVDLTEFLVGMKGELNERRKKMIRYVQEAEKYGR